MKNISPDFNSNVILTFPIDYKVTPLNSHEVMVEFNGDPFAEIFTKTFIEDLERELGKQPAQRWLEETTERLARELLLQQVR